MEKHLIERIFYILSYSEEKDKENKYEDWEDVYTIIDNHVSKKILIFEKQEVSSSDISKRKQNYINLFNSTKK